jgi:hypothetical protein
MISLKNILTLFCILSISISCRISNKDKEKIELSDMTGIWTVSDYNDTKKFSDTWEFKENGIFNELKLKGEEDSEFGDGSLIADENGTWTLINNVLTIIATGEYINGKPFLYDEPITWTFKVIKEDEILRLDILTLSNDANPSISALKLTKME